MPMRYDDEYQRYRWIDSALCEIGKNGWSTGFAVKTRINGQPSAIAKVYEYTLTKSRAKNTYFNFIAIWRFQHQDLERVPCIFARMTLLQSNPFESRWANDGR